MSQHQAAKSYAKHLQDARRTVIKELYVPKVLKDKVSKELSSEEKHQLSTPNK